ncbi:hypothetical protein KUF71_021852 [Frankliniella fusca]|uniref:Mucin-5AC-like n=1 Tax=Frankliniella fusca TaxID=407009 RepID=A0AAE1H007_9NEOP|nr:hypothetical protein KUF71_021852 [Frankliniella fusca]
MFMARLSVAYQDGAVALLTVLVLAVVVDAHNHNRHAARPARHVKRHLEEFLEPPPPPPPPGRGPAAASIGAAVVRSRRGNGPGPAPGNAVPGPAPAGTAPSPPPLSLGERIARWFYAGPNDGPGTAKQHGNKGGPLTNETPTMVGLSPPPPPPGASIPAQPQGPPPMTAEAAALSEQKPPPPQQLQPHPQPQHPPSQLDQHASGTEHHPQGYGGGGGGGGGGGYGGRPQNYPVLMPQSYMRTTDCNPCNNVPWVPMAREHGGGGGGGGPQDSYGPPAAGTGEAWGQASDAVPLAHAPIAFPALHKGPLPPIFPAEDFTHVAPDPPSQPSGLRDHLVPPTPEHDSVVFTINEEARVEPPPPQAQEQAGNELDGVGELKSAPDQVHQGTLQHHNVHLQQQHALAQHQVSHAVSHGQHGHRHHGFVHQHHGQHLVHQHHVPPPPNSLHQQPYSASAAKGAQQQHAPQHAGVELVQSVPIASYLASIEYPMTFIQSPLIEIPVKSVPFQAAPHGFVHSQTQADTQGQGQAVQQPYQVVAPTPLSSGAHQLHTVEHVETHAGALPLQGESAQAPQPPHAPRLADSAPESSAAVQHTHVHNLQPPCRHYAAALAAAQAQLQAHEAQAQRQASLLEHHEDAATANSQNSHAYAQEVAHFESHKVSAGGSTRPTASPNNYRHLEDSSSPSPVWSSSTAAPATSAWDTSAAATVTANGASGYSAPSAPSAPESAPSAPAAPSGKKKTKQIQIIVPYTIDKESGQVRLHSELMPAELSGTGAGPGSEADGTLSYTPPPELPPSALADLPSGLEALVQQTARKVPQGVTHLAANHQHHQHHQPQAQESVVVAELSPTPWQAQQQDKGAVSAADPFAGLQHILATDLRTLLRNEEDSVDRLRLQKNIDNWTAQEYSSLKAIRDTEGQEANPGVVTFNFTSTTASVGTSPSAPASPSSTHSKLIPSKKIPKEYLTTTPLSVSTTPATPSSTSPAPKSTASRKKEAAADTTKRPAKMHHVRKNVTRDDRRTKNGWTLVENLVVPGPTTTAVTATTSGTSTAAPSTSAFHRSTTPAPPTPDNHRPSDQTHAPWERLQVSISPLTREKVKLYPCASHPIPVPSNTHVLTSCFVSAFQVYVVTPLSTTAGEPATTTTDSPASARSSDTTASDAAATTKSVNINDLSPFRKWMDVPSTTPVPSTSSTQHTRARFSIRPTPGWPKPRPGPAGFRSTSAPALPTAERLAGVDTTTTTSAADKGVTKTSRATPRGFAVETISGHSKVFTATTSAWSKKKAVDSDTKKTTTAKPTTASVTGTAGTRTTRALKSDGDKAGDGDDVVDVVTAAPAANHNHHVDLSDIDAEASASVLHRHVAQLTPLGAAVPNPSPPSPFTTTTTEESVETPTTSADPAAGASGPEIVIVEGRRETSTVPSTTDATTTDGSTTLSTTEASTSTPSVTEATSSRTTRAIKTIGRRPDGSRYIMSEAEAKQFKQQNGLTAQRTKLQAVSTPKKYESPPPRPKPPKQAQAAVTDALFRRKPSRRPAHLIMTPDRGSYLWNFSEFSGTSHEDMAEDDMSAIKGAVVELKKESSPAPSTTPTTASVSSTTPFASTTSATGSSSSSSGSSTVVPGA